MQRHTSNQLNVKMPHAQRPFGSFAYGCKCLGKKFLQGFALLNPGTEFSSLGFQFFIGKRYKIRLQPINYIDRLHQTFDITFVGVAEYFFYKS
ncbi:hypothetical protein D3C74_460260 [compost metagenome]